MLSKNIAAAFLIAFISAPGWAQETETRNMILVTLDGLRWQEVFAGADLSIAETQKYVSDTASIQQFLTPNDRDHRAALMPFLWDVVAKGGQLYGNRDYGNKVNCTNNHLISYPGYSEMLVGFRYRKVSSNRKINNPHATVFEKIGDHPHFRNEVAAFATWDVFPYILRETKSDIYVNAGDDVANGKISHREKELNELLINGAGRSDKMTFQYAMEYLKRERPKVSFISFDGTDHFAHQGKYDQYLQAAHDADQMIAELWQWVQSQPDYRDKTTLFITTDHGRGSGKNNWRNHRLLAAGSRHIWFAVVGPDTPASGEMMIRSKSYQNQVAKTLAAFLGLPYKNEKPVGEAVRTMISVPQQENTSAISSRKQKPVSQ